MKNGQNLIFLLTALFAWLPSALVASPNPIVSYQVEFPPELQKRLRQQLSQSVTEKLHTKHLNKSGKPTYSNRLLLESSPYLKQHAHNPVNWYSWSEEAFERAAYENKPIFLSIGYSTCHWCHVMARESFDDLEVAALLNQHFISIKLDREEHPDVDQTYMSAAALLSGYTGWPLNAFLMPDGSPFYAATYFPKPQFLDLLTQVNRHWVKQPEELRKESTKVLQQLQNRAELKTDLKASTEGLAFRTARQWLQLYDEFHGGVGTAPKFPNEPMLFLWLDQAVTQKDTDLLRAVLHSLRMMQQGGIYDQVGGGFHRYATDPEWNIPHFEKMLYTQAQLARIYLYAWQLSGSPEHLRTAENTLSYLLRELQHPAGVFYSATDADSDGGEGRFFIWNKEQLEAALPDKTQFDLAWRLFGLDEGSNFDGHNILYLPRSLSEFSIDEKRQVQPFLQQLDQIKKQLLHARGKRPYPARDNKVITAWNAMTIRTLAEASNILDKPEFLTAAERAAEWLWLNHYHQGELIRSSHKGTKGPGATLEDYAYLAQSYITLYDYSQNKLWLKRGVELTNKMLEKFWDNEQQHLYQSPDKSLLPLRAQNHRDNVTPSATSMALELLNQLATRDSNPIWQDTAMEIFSSIAAEVIRQPMAHSYLLTVSDAEINSPFQPIRYAAQGAIRAALDTSSPTLQLSLAPGWHINAHVQPRSELIATQVKGDNLKRVSYPEGKPLAVAFSPEPIMVYSGKVELPLQMDKSVSAELPEEISLTVQACSTVQCLPPETMTFSLFIN